MMGKLQIIHTDGEDLVVIPRRASSALRQAIAGMKSAGLRWNAWQGPKGRSPQSTEE
jgi:hypothetical protein